MVQEHLTLGYETGNRRGEMSTERIVAISRFQAENDMPVTGEPSAQLAGILAARVSSTNAPPQRFPAELQAPQQACLQKKIEETQAAKDLGLTEDEVAACQNPMLAPLFSLESNGATGGRRDVSCRVDAASTC